MSQNIRFLLALLGIVAMPAVISAQAELPRIDLGRGVIQLSSSSFGGGSSIQKTVRDGVTTIKVTEKDGNKVTIVDDPDNGITVKMTKRYGPENADKLEKSMPGLYMHLKSIPKTANKAKIEVHVDVTKDYEADDKEDLKNKHPEVFKVYEKYTKGGGGGAFRLGRGRIMRPIEIRPLDIEMKIDDLKKEIEKKIDEAQKLRMEIPEVGGLDRGLEKKKEKKEEKKEKKGDKKTSRKDT